MTDRKGVKGLISRLSLIGIEICKVCTHGPCDHPSTVLIGFNGERVGSEGPKTSEGPCVLADSTVTSVLFVGIEPS